MMMMRRRRRRRRRMVVAPAFNEGEWFLSVFGKVTQKLVGPQSW